MAARPQTFRAWLRGYREVDNKIGDIARDVQRDRDFPREPLSWKRIAEYLHGLGASSAAIAAAGEAWRLYRTEVHGTVRPVDQDWY